MNYTKTGKNVRILRNRGLSLIEVMIASSLFIIFLVSAGAYVYQKTKNHRNFILKRNINMIVENYINLLHDSSNWEQTITGNSAKLNTFTYFSPKLASFLPFSTYDPENNPNHGFTFQGEFCDTFSQATPSDQCPFRLRFSWRDDSSPCSGSLPCQSIINIEVETSLVDGSSFQSINFGKLNRTFTRPGTTTTVQSMNCNASVPEVVTGFQADGQAICTPAADVLNP